MYVTALRLAPLALVQAVVASGVAVLAFATAHGHPSRLARREQLAVVLAVAGLALLALSLVGTTPSDEHPPVIGIIIWLAACGGGAVLLMATPTRIARAAALGHAGGCQRVAPLVCPLQHAGPDGVGDNERGERDQLQPAVADELGGDVPVGEQQAGRDGFVLFGETLPRGMRAVLQVASFACLVASAVALGRKQAPRASKPAPRADRIEQGPQSAPPES